MTVVIRELHPQDQAPLLELWAQAKAEQTDSPQPTDLAKSIEIHAGLSLAVMDDEQLVGGAIFDPSQRPAIHWLILDPKHRDQKSVQLLMDKIAVKLRSKGLHSLRIQCLGATDPLTLWPVLRWPQQPRLDRRPIANTA